MSLPSLRFFTHSGLAWLAMALSLGLGSAAAQTVPQGQITPAAEDPPCFCWADGRKIAEGQTACIRTSTGRRLAACDRVINMMSWRVSDEICPES